MKELLIVNSVKKYLHCTDGKLIEAFYKNNQNLDNYHRNILARVIIYKEYEVLNFPNRFKITTDRFLSLNLEIAELFPNEKNVLSLYYTPYQTHIKKPACGKLWDNYNHLKSKLCKTDNKIEQTFNKVDEDVKEKIEFLKKNTTPLSKIFDFWRCTIQERNKLLNKQNSVLQYFETFPILKTSKGAELLTDDFDQKYPTSINKIFTHWPQIQEKLLKYAGGKNKELIKIANSNCSFKGFLILCHCLANSIYKRCDSTKKRRKLTKPEVIGCFLNIHEVSIVKYSI